MTSSNHDRSTLDAIAPLREAGFALHWLHPKSKRPIGKDWSEVPVADLATLIRTRAAGNNLGVRLGEPSKMAAGGWLHIIDLDIRVADLADEAWEAFERLFPGLNRADFPMVESGSGGESRHVYLITDKPFFGRMLAHSEGKHRREKVDPKTGEIKEGWSYDWEIELFGTGKQAAMPPSIHPDTGKPYLWAREFDFELLNLGIGPFIPAAAIEALGAVNAETYAFETREPLEFKPGQLDTELALIDVGELHYDDWIRLGQALHHQFGGSEEGWNLWLAHTRRSKKYDGDDRTMRKKYRSFGRYRGQPVTMASVRQWAQEARAAAFQDAFDDLEDDDESDPFDDDDEDDDLDDLLGGDDEDDDPFERPSKGDADDPMAWVSLLDLNEEGAVKPTLHNIELILKNDIRLAGLPQLNEFTQETVQRTPPGQKANRRKNATKVSRQLAGRVWQIKDTLNGELWSDDRDFSVRCVIEAPKTQGGYGLKVSDRDLKAATVLAANEHAFHPIREYLGGLAWDGVPRVESLFTDYLGAPDDAYTRSVSRLMMVGAVTRVFEPGHKFDFAVIMEGLQGKRKSTFISTLGRSWFAELDGDFHDPKVMIELMQGAWIMEIPELSGFGRADVRSIKAFISRQKDRARLAYARRAGEFPRQCIFIGSTNDREYLKDDTGGRRFWPMPCTFDEIDIARLERNVDQLWAEAVSLYTGMRKTQPHGTLPLYLVDADAKSIAVRLQESRRVESADDGLAGRLSAWLDRPVSSGGFDEEDAKPQPRNHTCLLEIWVEVMGGDLRSYKQAEAQAIGRTMKLLDDWQTDGTLHNFPAPYGRQRVYERVGTFGRITPPSAT
jgi:hypothetical protein